MLGLIIAILFGLATKCVIEKMAPTVRRELRLFGWFVMIAVSFLSFPNISILTQDIFNPVYHQTNTINLVSLKTLNTVSGRLFIGTGTVDSKPSYYYYTQNPDGGYSLQQITASRATIYEENRNDGEYKELRPDKVYWLVSFLWETKKEFHIPIGSISGELDPNIR